MLCNLQLNGLVEGLKGLGWTPGQEFEIVTVSIDPRETPTLARMKKQSDIAELGRPSAGAGWHFTTAREAEIRRLAETVGFRYTYDPREDQYAHAAALMVVMPDGRVARYLYGIEYPPRDLRLALLEASRGEIGSPWDQILLFCYHYDPSSRQYAPVAMNIMRLGGGVTVVALGSALGLLWARELRRKKSPSAGVVGESNDPRARSLVTGRSRGGKV
jgi:protein SCO1/2